KVLRHGQNGNDQDRVQLHHPPQDAWAEDKGLQNTTSMTAPETFSASISPPPGCTRATAAISTQAMRVPSVGTRHKTKTAQLSSTECSMPRTVKAMNIITALHKAISPWACMARPISWPRAVRAGAISS